MKRSIINAFQNKENQEGLEPTSHWHKTQALSAAYVFHRRLRGHTIYSSELTKYYQHPDLGNVAFVWFNSNKKKGLMIKRDENIGYLD